MQNAPFTIFDPHPDHRMYVQQLQKSKKSGAAWVFLKYVQLGQQ